MQLNKKNVDDKRVCLVFLRNTGGHDRGGQKDRQTYGQTNIL